MEPEIARRCPDCGASVRGGSFFCPQCGKPLKPRAAQTGVAAAEAPEVPVRRKTDVGQNASTTTRPEGVTPEPASGVVPAQGTPARGAAAQPVSPRADVSAPPPPAPTPRVSESVVEDERSKRQGRAAAARDAVEEKLSPRVEKLRHASNVMLEEASYDPSLRFVLVAVVLILLSLLLLLLNYLLG